MTIMKVLSRIEGDEGKTGNIIENLIEILPKNNFPKSNAKLQEMKNRLGNSGYTSFWS